MQRTQIKTERIYSEIFNNSSTEEAEIGIHFDVCWTSVVADYLSG